MNTSILFYSKSSSGKSQYARRDLGRDCCQYLKGSDYSGYYQEIFAYHPNNSSHQIDKHSQRIIDAINFFFGGWFTITLVTAEKDLKKFRNDSRSSFHIKFGFHIVIHNEGVTKGRKQFNQLLFPLTLSRWAVAGGPYRITRAKFLDILDNFPLDSIYLPALLQTMDVFHQYYPVTTAQGAYFYDKENFFDSLGKTNTSAIPDVTGVMEMGFKGLKGSLPSAGQYPYANISASIAGMYKGQTLSLAILYQVEKSGRNSIDAVSLYNNLAESLYEINERVKIIVKNHLPIKTNSSYGPQYLKLYRDLAEKKSNQI